MNRPGRKLSAVTVRTCPTQLTRRGKMIPIFLSALPVLLERRLGGTMGNLSCLRRRVR
jgi:hypothetical protein